HQQRGSHRTQGVLCYGRRQTLLPQTGRGASSLSHTSDSHCRIGGLGWHSFLHGSFPRTRELHHVCGLDVLWFGGSERVRLSSQVSGSAASLPGDRLPLDPACVCCRRGRTGPECNRFHPSKCRDRSDNRGRRTTRLLSLAIPQGRGCIGIDAFRGPSSTLKPFPL